MIAGDALLKELMRRGGIPDRSNAEATIEAALEALAQYLAPADVRIIAEQLPAAFAPALARRGRSALASPSDLYAPLAASEGVSLGSAVEHAQAAGAAIAESVDSEGRSLLARRLPPDWAASLPHGLRSSHRAGATVALVDARSRGSADDRPDQVGGTVTAT